MGASARAQTALICLASPKKSSTTLLGVLRLSSVSRYLTLVNQADPRGPSTARTFTTANDRRRAGSRRPMPRGDGGGVGSLSRARRVITGEIFAYIRSMRTIKSYVLGLARASGLLLTQSHGKYASLLSFARCHYVTAGEIPMCARDSSRAPEAGYGWRLHARRFSKVSYTPRAYYGFYRARSHRALRALARGSLADVVCLKTVRRVKMSH